MFRRLSVCVACALLAAGCSDSRTDGPTVAETSAVTATPTPSNPERNFTLFESGQVRPLALSADEQAFVEERERWSQDEGGYGHIQATRPQTLAYGLTDSPAGQAAWILEKFWAWTDCDGHPENILSRDDVRRTG